MRPPMHRCIQVVSSSTQVEVTHPDMFRAQAVIGMDGGGGVHLHGWKLHANWMDFYAQEDFRLTQTVNSFGALGIRPSPVGDSNFGMCSIENEVGVRALES